MLRTYSSRRLGKLTSGGWFLIAFLGACLLALARVGYDGRQHTKAREAIPALTADLECNRSKAAGQAAQVKGLPLDAATLGKGKRLYFFAKAQQDICINHLQEGAKRVTPKAVEAAQALLDKATASVAAFVEWADAQGPHGTSACPPKLTAPTDLSAWLENPDAKGVKAMQDALEGLRLPDWNEVRAAPVPACPLP
jgi:hypothetical protein